MYGICITNRLAKRKKKKHRKPLKTLTIQLSTQVNLFCFIYLLKNHTSFTDQTLQ